MMTIKENHRPDGNGKGDKPRPINDWDRFESNWNSIFGKKEKQDDSTTTTTGTEKGTK